MSNISQFTVETPSGSVEALNAVAKHHKAKQAAHGRMIASAVAVLELLKDANLSIDHMLTAPSKAKDSTPAHFHDYYVGQRMAAFAYAERIHADPSEVMQFAFGEGIKGSDELKLGNARKMTRQHTLSAIRDVWRWTGEGIAEHFKNAANEFAEKRDKNKARAIACANTLTDANGKLSRAQSNLAKKEEAITKRAEQIKANPKKADKLRIEQADDRDAVEKISANLTQLETTIEETQLERAAFVNATMEYDKSYRAEMANVPAKYRGETKTPMTFEVRCQDTVRKLIDKIKKAENASFEIEPVLDGLRAALTAMKQPAI